MSYPTINYATAPKIRFRSPECGACQQELESLSNGWNCFRCGTIWAYNSADSAVGTLFEAWTGEVKTGESRDHKSGHLPTDCEKTAVAWAQFTEEIQSVSATKMAAFA